MTPSEAAALILTEAEQLVEMEAAKLIQKEAPIVINRLQLAEKNKPGFLGIRKDLDIGLVDLFNLALEWAKGINPPAQS
jgi:hypothetical protein